MGGSSNRVYGSRIGVSGSYDSGIVSPMTENKMEKLEKFYGSWDYVVAYLGFPNICGAQFLAVFVVRRIVYWGPYWVPRSSWENGK